MRIHVLGRGLRLTEDLRAHGERRVLFALGRFGRQVESVRVVLDDVNGPRGGVDKRCRISVQTVGGVNVHIQSRDEGLYTVIDRGAARARRALAREIGRRHEATLGATPPGGKEAFR